MKKVILGFVVLLIALAGVFHQQIISTLDFYTFQRENHTAFTKSSMDWKPVSFSSSDYSTISGQPLTINNLKVPVPFSITSRNERVNFAQGIGNIKSLTITTKDTPEDFFSTNNFTTQDKKAACQFLSNSSGLGACISQYNLLRAFLELNKTDLHFFSNIEDKNLYNRMMLIRASTIVSNTVSGFETSRIKGFLFTLDSNNYVAQIFDHNDKLYEITFTNLDEAEVSFVLMNITII